MNESMAVQCRITQGGTWVLCPVCRAGKVQKLAATTRAQSLTVFCRRCKRESVIDVKPLGTGGGPRVTLAAPLRGPGVGEKVHCPAS